MSVASHAKVGEKSSHELCSASGLWKVTIAKIELAHNRNSRLPKMSLIANEAGSEFLANLMFRATNRKSCFQTTTNSSFSREKAMAQIFGPITLRLELLFQIRGNNVR